MPSTLRRSRLWLLALAGLAALLAAAALSLAPANADGHRSPELVLSLVDDSDNIVAVGSTLNVRAQLRFSGDDAPGGWMNILADSNLRLSGSLDWDDTSVAGSRLLITAAQIAGLPSATPLIPTVGGTAYDIDNFGGGHKGVLPVAYDGRTLVARSGEPTTAGTFHIFDLSAAEPTQVAELAGVANERSGTAATGVGLFSNRPAAVWDQNATTAWLFIGAPAASTNVGKLYIYKITYGASVTVTATADATVLSPPMSEYTNRYAGGTSPHYGAAISISSDGQTLAVGAPGMNEVGAAYVYTMPSGTGEDWSDLDYADGVKVTPVQIPAWGTTGTASTLPFDSTMAANCAAASYCARVTASQGSDFGRYLEIADDGTLVVSAAVKRVASDTTVGGGFGANNANTGAVWVFNAPDGGWDAAPDATAGSTLVAGQATAASFNPASNHSPGPAKRVEAAAAELLPAAFGDASRATNQNFGIPTSLSADGSTVAALATNGGSDASRIYVFEKPSGGWADSSTPTATLGITASGTQSSEGSHGIDINNDGTRVLFSSDEAAVTVDGETTMRAGAVYVFEPVAGGWAAKDSTPATEEADGIYVATDAQIVASPSPADNVRFTAPLYNNDGTLIAWADTDILAATWPAGVPPRLYAPVDPCADRTLDGETTTTCTLDLGNTAVTVPAGTPEGKFTISGRVNLEFSDLTQPTNGASGAVEVTIGKVQEVASATLALATDIGDPTQSGDEKPYPALLRSSGDDTRLLLRILNENGFASHGGSVAAVLVTSTAGRLSVLDPDLAGDDCANISCQLDNTEINASNADRLIIVLTHAGKAATASVRATVFSTAGDSFETEL